ncbi:AraC family transcriptional regulator [Chitinophaga silvatica]|uniref:AraC family transcriptional regulator n=1 Tax=Chitinophaga silvatica TaxID=2282649 RepID=A0A3E1YE09_9BACT|nr:AraC family transcriptional regulator [Chitinophaga silvatica]RFS24805.1 AraC family transcriptional regulator [Chitinophaga silvatica]
MTETNLYIKNMVCPRCIKVVSSVLEAQHFNLKSIELGKAVVGGTPDADQLQQLSEALEKEGFSLIDDKKQQIVASIKSIVIDKVHHSELDDMKENFSSLLAGKLLKDYHYLSNLFSELEGTTIEQFIIQQKIEKVKELLVYNELSLSEISYKLGYSSVAHLSAQFKKVTGLTPSKFKQLKAPERISIDKL